MPFPPSSFLLLVAMPGAPRSVLDPFVAMPFAPSDARSYVRSFLFLEEDLVKAQHKDRKNAASRFDVPSLLDTTKSKGRTV